MRALSTSFIEVVGVRPEEAVRGVREEPVVRRAHGVDRAPERAHRVVEALVRGVRGREVRGDLEPRVRPRPLLVQQGLDLFERVFGQGR